MLAKTRRYLLLFLLFTILTAVRVAAQSFRFLRRHVQISGIELTLYLPSGADPEPHPPPQVFTYRRDAPDGSRQFEERFDIRDLWRREQRVGSWIDSHNNRLELARVSSPAPPADPVHVSRNAFDRWWERQHDRPLDDRDENLLQWVIDYTGDPEARSRGFTRPPLALRDLVLFEWDAIPHQIGFIFRLNPAAAGQAQVGDQLFFARLQTHPQIAPDIVRREAAERFLPSIAWAGRQTAAIIPDDPIAETGPAGSDITPPEGLETGRRQIRESIRNLTDWWYEETTHYIILTDIKSQARRLIDRLTEDLDTMRNAYEILAPPPREITEVSVIRIFAESTDYVRYVGEDYAWSGGLWKPSRREMVVRHPDRSPRRASLENILRTVRHEAFHQYLFYAFDRIQPCAWYNEGHAVFVEYAQPQRHLVVEPHAFYEDLMIGLARDRRSNIPRLLAMDYPEFYNPDDTRRQENYALAWGLIYYLRLAEPRTQNLDTVTAILDRYIEALWKERSGPAATRSAWQDVDMDDFVNDFEHFWSSPMRRSRARRRRLFEF